MRNSRSSAAGESTTGRKIERALNVIVYWKVLDTKTGGDGNLSVNGSREVEMEGVSDERPGDHRRLRYKKEWKKRQEDEREY